MLHDPRHIRHLPAVEQWGVIAATPRLFRWWHLVACAVDIVVIVFVFILAWLLAGAGWRVVPAAVYVVGGVVIAGDVFVHGPSSTAAKFGLIMGSIQIYLSVYPLFLPSNMVRTLAAQPLPPFVC